MGYFVDLNGEFTVKPALHEDVRNFLNGLSRTRRMKRDNMILERMGFQGDYGVEGEFFIEGKGDFGEYEDESVIDADTPPNTQPGLWCSWKADESGTKIFTDDEQFYHSADWLKYLIEKILKPNGYTVNGDVTGKIMREDADKFYIKVRDNDVFVKGDYDYAYHDSLWDEKEILLGNQMTFYEAFWHGKRNA